MFDVNFLITNTNQLEPFFNPTKRASCVYLQDTLVQIEGYCQLKEIVVLKENKVIYKIVISGKKRDFFSKIANRTLQDIQGLGNSIYNDTKIQEEWTTSPDYGSDKLVYPQINKGIDYTSTSVNWARIYDFVAYKPFVYVKNLLDNIIKDAGFEYESDFINSEQFKKLILQCDVNSFLLNQAERDQSYVFSNRSSSASISSSATLSLSSIWNNQLIWDNVVNDFSGQYNNTTGTFTMANNGYTNFTFKNNFVYIPFSAPNLVLRIYVILKRGSNYSLLKDYRQGLSNVGTTQFDAEFSVLNTLLNTGDEVRLCIGPVFDFAGVRYPAPISLTWASSGTTNEMQQYVNGQIQYGNNFSVASIQYPIQQKDFIIGLCKMFNLYIDTDILGKLIIEPRDDFFIEDYVDWTKKLDVSKDFKIVPQGLLETKRLEYNYTMNDDYYSNYFKKDAGNIHGYFNKNIENDFVKDIKKIEVPFCLPPLVNKVFGIGMCLTKEADTVNAELSPKPIIAYYGGLINGDEWYFSEQGVGNVRKTQYAYAGHLDHPITPSYDLCFGQQILYYFKNAGNGLTLPKYNLFNQFHYKNWVEIADLNSKLIEGYFKLSSTDIAALSFRKLYFIKDAYYRLLEIQDYNPNGRTTTLCKFLKINGTESIVNTTTTGTGNGGSNGNGDGWTSTNTDGNGDTHRGNGVRGGIVLGTGNTMGDNSGFAVVLGNGNIVGSGERNVTIINVNDTNITSSNVTMIGFNTLNVNADINIIGNEGSPLYLICDTTAGDINITVNYNTDATAKLLVVVKEHSLHQIEVFNGDGASVETITSDKYAEFLSVSNSLIKIK